MFTIFVFLLFFSPLSAGYRRGDVVDTMIQWSNSLNNDILRKTDMPLFGQDTSSLLKIPSHIGGPFSIRFEDGLFMLPVMDSTYLENVEVTFIYSKSGGFIHSVSSSKTMTQHKFGGHSFQIEYTWIEEAPLQINAGFGVMFLATLIASVFFLLQAYSITEVADDRNPLESSKSNAYDYRE